MDTLGLSIKLTKDASDALKVLAKSRGTSKAFEAQRIIERNMKRQSRK